MQIEWIEKKSYFTARIARSIKAFNAESFQNVSCGKKVQKKRCGLDIDEKTFYLKTKFRMK